MKVANTESNPETSQVRDGALKPTPGKWDVLCGRGRGNYEHPGNRRFLAIVDPFKSEYKRTPKLEKVKLAENVAAKVLALQGVNFVKKVKVPSSTGEHCTMWQTLDSEEMLAKVAHTLREKRTVVKLETDLTDGTIIDNSKPETKTQKSKSPSPISKPSSLATRERAASFEKLRHEQPLVSKPAETWNTLTTDIVDPIPMSERSRFLSSCSTMLGASEIELLFNSEALMGQPTDNPLSERSSLTRSLGSRRSGSLMLMSLLGSTDSVDFSMFDLDEGAVDPWADERAFARTQFESFMDIEEATLG